MKSYTLELITPLFSTGTDKNQPEVRAASIRGQLHWWFRALGGSYELEKEIFGGVHQGAQASRLVVRVACDQMPAAKVIPTLPHKNGGRAAPKAAFPAGSSFRVLFSQRLGSLSNEAKAMLDRTIQLWLLCGSLGLRSTRGGGAFQVSDSSGDSGSLMEDAQQLIGDAQLRIAVLDKSYPGAEEARHDITDTLMHTAMERLRYPLGAVRQGRGDSAPKRKTSPLRLTVRRFNDGFCIVAVWDARQEVTGNTPDHLRQAVQILVNARKPIGDQLSRVIDHLAR